MRFDSLTGGILAGLPCSGQARCNLSSPVSVHMWLELCFHPCGSMATVVARAQKLLLPHLPPPTSHRPDLCVPVVVPVFTGSAAFAATNIANMWSQCIVVVGDMCAPEIGIKNPRILTKNENSILKAASTANFKIKNHRVFAWNSQNN